MRNPRIVVIDQDEERRADIQRMLALSRFAVVGEAGYGVEAVSLAKETAPDVIVISLDGSLNRAMKTLESLCDTLPQVPTIAYSSVSDAAVIRGAMQAGARDYLLLPLKPEDLAASINVLLEQEARRRQRLLSEEADEGAHGTIITVFGAKGGIGKTTIATNLAVALVRETQQSVALADLDTRFGDVAIIMDVPVERSITDLAREHGPDSLNRDLLREYLYRHNTGVMILPAPSRPTEWRNLGLDHLERIIQLLAQLFDYVVLDTPGTFNDIVGKALEAATIVLMVTSTDMSSIKDTLLALDLLQGWSFPPDRVKIVVNQANIGNGIGLEDVREVLGRDIFWHIPHDRAVIASTQVGTPVVVSRPTAKASYSLRNLALALSGVSVHRNGKGLLSRFRRR